MKKILLPLLFAITCFSCSYPYKQLIKELKLDDGIYAQFTSSKGTFYAQLDYENSPLTACNFICLAEGNMPNGLKNQGEPFYNQTMVYKVMSDFIIETGDPGGTGSGNPGYTFKDEKTTLNHNKAGVLSMANSGPNSNGCRYFITLSPASFLNGKHVAFGHVVKGMEVVKELEKGDIIEKVVILRVGKTARKFDALATFNALK